MQQARDRLADADAILGTAHPAVVVSAAYYGMLYAARAALSERGEFAKTHSGTWTLFSQIFVAPGECCSASILSKLRLVALLGVSRRRLLRLALL